MAIGNAGVLARGEFEDTGLTGMDLVTAFTSVVASVNNLGPGIGQTGPAGNYQGLTDLQTWICTVAMLLGRLEIFSVLILFTVAFWRK